MKYPESEAERVERAARIRHARKLESVLRASYSFSMARVVAFAYDDAEGMAGTTTANNLLRRRRVRIYPYAK